MVTSSTALVPPDDPLAAAPAALTGAFVGYARVSTAGQLLDRQLHALTEVGCIKVFADEQSGKDTARPQLAACLAFLRAGDTLVVPSLDRLSRSLRDLITMVAELRRREVGFRSLHEVLDTTTAGGRLVFHVFAADGVVVAEFGDPVQGVPDEVLAAVPAVVLFDHDGEHIFEVVVSRSSSQADVNGSRRLCPGPSVAEILRRILGASARHSRVTVRT